MKRSKTSLREALQKLKTGNADFQIAARVGAGYLARTRAGSIAWLVPLTEVPETAGRRAGGFVLSPSALVAFEFSGKKWKSPAAVWESTEPDLLDTFLVLLDDAATALGPKTTWAKLVEYVDDWQALLARRTALSTEQQLGLWAELMVLASASEIDALLAGWCGPDGKAVDFFLDGVGLEIKASRRRHAHFVSQSQVDRPVGDRDSHLLSFWATSDPGTGRSLVDLVATILARVVEKGAFLKLLAKVGYSVADQAAYSAVRFTALEAPLLFRRSSVPRIDAVDPAISELRYLVTLDPSLSSPSKEVQRTRAHFGIDLPVGASDVGGQR